MAQGRISKLLKLVVRELSPDDKYYDLLRMIVSRVVVEDSSNTPSDTISIYRENFNDISVGSYFIREDGSGKTQGLYKKVDGVLLPVSFPLPGEIRIIKGSGIGAIQVPQGWRLVTETTLQEKYNTGVSPNWTSAAIEYVGI